MSTNCRFAMATHVMAILALKGDGPTTSEYMAGSINTNPVVVRRLIAALGRAGLVRAPRGAAGRGPLAHAAARLRPSATHGAGGAKHVVSVPPKPQGASPGS